MFEALLSFMGFSGSFASEQNIQMWLTKSVHYVFLDQTKPREHNVVWKQMDP
jgi:hypothetical protein